jgi:hypothetical protein
MKALAPVGLDDEARALRYPGEEQISFAVYTERDLIPRLTRMFHFTLSSPAPAAR